MQHNCSGACTNTRAIREIQEYEETVKVRYQVQHSDNSHFIINLHGIHNAQLIRRALPSNLYIRRAQTSDPEAIFQSAVEKLSISKVQKARLAAARKQAQGIVVEAIQAVAADAADEETGTGDGEDVELDVVVSEAGIGRGRGRKRQSDASTTVHHATKPKVWHFRAYQVHTIKC
jgi:hypothetical protein